MIHIHCNTCDSNFGVEDVVTSKGFVAVLFHCPYCGAAFETRSHVDLVGMSGGVNIGGGANISVGGDIGD